MRLHPQRSILNAPPKTHDPPERMGQRLKDALGFTFHSTLADLRQQIRRGGSEQDGRGAVGAVWIRSPAGRRTCPVNLGIWH